MTERKFQFDTVVVGMGHTGLSCARFLAKQGTRFAMTDTRDNPPMQETIRQMFPDIPLHAGGLDEETLLGAENILISPGLSMHVPELQAARSAGINIYGDVELFSRFVNAPVVAITGSNGKSTVTTLVAEMTRASKLNTAVGGNLGTPVLDLLSGDVELYVLELSSFQLETVTSLKPLAATVLNVSEDHMDRYDNFESYRNAKSRVYRNADAMVINLDDDHVKSMSQTGRRTICFGTGEPAGDHYGLREYNGRNWLVRGQNKLLPADELRIAGTHNISNALAAFALCDALHLQIENLCNVLRTFPGLQHRCQFVDQSAGIRWINDSKGTNVGATCAAIRGLAGNRNIILIAGGEGKGADFSGLADEAKKYLKSAVLIGQDAPRLKRVLEPYINVTGADTMEEAVKMASGQAESGDIVLLSPACASFDMFLDYRDRGDRFISAVRAWVEKHG